MLQAISRFFKEDNRKHFFSVLSVFLFYAISRLFLIWRYGDIAFGYDTGIYRFNINAYWDKFGQTDLPPFAFSWFSIFFKLLGFSTDMVMFGVYFATACAMFWSLYLLVKKYFDLSATLWTVFLFTISIIQFEFYQWYYYRSFVAITLLLFTLLLFSYYSYFSLLPLILATCFHPLSAIPVILAIIAMGWLDKEHRRYWLVLFGITFICSCTINWSAFYEHYLFLKSNRWLAGNDNFGSTESTGQFISLMFFLRAMFIYGLFSIIGIITNIKKNKILPLIAFFSLVAMLFRIMFYRRLFIWLDLILIIYAGVFLSNLTNKFFNQKTMKLAIFVFCLIGSANISRFIYLKSPIISNSEFYAIYNSDNLRESEYVLSFSNKYSPWLYGYTNKKVIAPGMFEYNKWNYEEWTIFWYGKDRDKIIELLNRYPTPIYIYLNNNDEYWLGNFENSQFIKKIYDHWYIFGK